MTAQRTALADEKESAATSLSGEEARLTGWTRFLSVQGLLWVIAAIGLLALWWWVLVSFRGQPGDDPFITYRYAANIASGNGFVYNQGEYVQSTTTPLFTLILAGGGLLGLDIPTFAYIVNALALLAFGVCCVGMVASTRDLSPWLGLAVFGMTILCSISLFGLGSEMPLMVALSWGAWWAAAKKKWAVAALLAALAALTRGDGVLVGAAIAAYFLITEVVQRRTPVRKWPWRAAALYLAVLAPWYIFAWLYFGSPLPSTLGTKIIQGTGEGATGFFEGLGYFWTRQFGYNPAWWIPALVLLAIGLIPMARRVNLTPPLIWAALYMAGYSLLNVPRYPWYYSPLVPVAMLAIVLGGSFLAGIIALPVNKVMMNKATSEEKPDKEVTRPARLAGGLLTALIIGGYYFAADAAATIPQQRPWLQVYVEAAKWLDANAPPNASLGAGEVGLLGYHSLQRRIIDLTGLIQPDVAGHSVRADNLWVLQTYNPDYIAERRAWMAAVGAHPWVQEHYEIAHVVEWPGSDPVTILKRKP